MKLIEIIETENYKQIKLQHTFLWKKYTNTYRKIGNNIFEYTPKNYYNHLGVCSHFEIAPYFEIKEIEV